MLQSRQPLLVCSYKGFSNSAYSFHRGPFGVNNGITLIDKLFHLMILFRSYKRLEVTGSISLPSFEDRRSAE
jgi:hypothetical protein